MSEVFSRFVRPRTLAAPAGTEYEDDFEYRLDAQGNKQLVKTGRHNLQDRIQSSLESTKIENILRRAQLGDPTALAAVNGQYIDVTGFPRNLAELQSLIIRVEQDFERLPLDVRRAYDFSAEKYIADYGSENWKNVLGIQDQPNEEVKQGEQEQ